MDRRGGAGRSPNPPVRQAATIERAMTATAPRPAAHQRRRSQRDRGRCFDRLARACEDRRRLRAALWLVHHRHGKPKPVAPAGHSLDTALSVAAFIEGAPQRGDLHRQVALLHRGTGPDRAESIRLWTRDRRAAPAARRVRRGHASRSRPAARRLPDPGEAGARSAGAGGIGRTGRRRTKRARPFRQLPSERQSLSAEPEPASQPNRTTAGRS